MDKSLERIIAAHLDEKEAAEEVQKESVDITASSPYVIPYSQMMDMYPYHTEQEMTDVHITLESPTHKIEDNGQTELDKMFIYPEQDWQNADWAGGNFLAPAENDIQKEFNRTDNDAQNLYDPMKGASYGDIADLSSKSANAIDGFLSPNYIKISSMDLEQFMKVSDDTLIHKSNKDVWQMQKDKEGNIYISRLTDDEVLEDK